MNLSQRQDIEIDYWRTSKDEAPEIDSVRNLINKMSDAAVLLSCFERHGDKLGHGRVIELGGGQGWASCVYKRIYPNATVIATDISPFAVASTPKWERLLEVKLDGSYACRSYETHEANASVDLVFSFAAAHHFVAHRRTVAEIARILKPGGQAIYFHEPVTPRYLYRLAHWRVNRKRPDVPEDVLITSELRRLAINAGLSLTIDHYPSLLKRGTFETLYFSVLSRVPILQRILPSSACLVFEKR